MNEAEHFVTAKDIRSRFHVSNGTLQRWAAAGKIKCVRLNGATESGKRLYRESDLPNVIAGCVLTSSENKTSEEVKKERFICYARVSSQKQRPDLERQVQSLKDNYPEHEIITDIASGLNWKRPGFLGLLDGAMRGDIREVVVTHKDRLCRFAYELIERIFHSCHCRIVVLYKNDSSEGGENSESELRDDLLAIVTVFVASSNGRRAAAHRKANRAAQSAQSAQSTTTAGADEVPEVEDFPDVGAEEDSEIVDGGDEVDLQHGDRDGECKAKGDSSGASEHDR